MSDDKKSIARQESRSQGWRPPTRRTFAQLLAAAAAAIALRDRQHKVPPIWIGHF